MRRPPGVDLSFASQPVHGEGLEAVEQFDEPIGVGVPHGHPLAGRPSVTILDLAGRPFVTAREGHWLRRLLDRLFAAKRPHSGRRLRERAGSRLTTAARLLRDTVTGWN